RGFRAGIAGPGQFRFHRRHSDRIERNQAGLNRFHRGRGRGGRDLGRGGRRGGDAIAGGLDDRRDRRLARIGDRHRRYRRFTGGIRAWRQRGLGSIGGGNGLGGDRLGSDRIGSDRIGSNRVGSNRIGSHRRGLGFPRGRDRRHWRHHGRRLDVLEIRLHRRNRRGLTERRVRLGLIAGLGFLVFDPGGGVGQGLAAGLQGGGAGLAPATPATTTAATATASTVASRRIAILDARLGGDVHLRLGLGG